MPQNEIIDRETYARAVANAHAAVNQMVRELDDEQLEYIIVGLTVAPATVQSAIGSAFKGESARRVLAIVEQLERDASFPDEIKEFLELARSIGQAHVNETVDPSQMLNAAQQAWDETHAMIQGDDDDE